MHLRFNNYEHFALRCKTGIREPHQVDALIKLLGILPRNSEWFFH